MGQAASAEQLTELEDEKLTNITVSLYFQAQICNQNVAPAALVCHFGALNNKLFISAPL